MDNNMKKEFEKLEEDLEVNKHMDSLKATVKKMLNWKMPGYDRIHGLKIHDHP